MLDRSGSVCSYCFHLGVHRRFDGFAEVGTQPVETENVLIKGSLKRHTFWTRLMPSVELFGISERKILKGQDLLQELEFLLPQPHSRMPTPLGPSGNSDTDDSDSEINDSLPTLQILTTETIPFARAYSNVNLACFCSMRKTTIVD